MNRYYDFLITRRHMSYTDSIELDGLNFSIRCEHDSYHVTVIDMITLVLC